MVGRFFYYNKHNNGILMYTDGWYMFLIMMMMVSIFPSLDSFNITDGAWLKIHSCLFMML